MAVQKPLVLLAGRPSVLPASDTLQGSIPAGGSTGQVLKKASGTDYEANWQDMPTVTIGTTAPASPAVGDIWVDTN